MLLRSASYGAGVEAATRFVSEAARDSEVVVLSHTRLAADELARAAPAGALAGVHRMSPGQFAGVLAAEGLAARSLAPVTRLGVEALASRAAHLLRVADKLSYFGPVAAMPGFARALASTLNELRLENVRPTDLARTGAPGRDLAGLLELYETELAGRGLADFATLLRLAAEAARTGKHRLLGLPLVLLDVALDSAAHRGFIAAAVKRSPAVCAIALDGDEAAIRALEEILSKQSRAAGDKPAVTLNLMRANLFSPQPLADRAPDETVRFFSAPGEGLECVEMARRIRALAEEGVSFDRVAILLRDPERYQPLVEEALRRAGIPGYFSRGVVRPDPAGRAFLALLACAMENCSASRFAEYLSLGQVPVLNGDRPRAWVAPENELARLIAGPAVETPEPADEDDAAPVIAGSLRAPFGWEKLLVDAAVVGGSGRWARRLSGLEAEFRLKLEDGEISDPRREHLRRQLELLINLERFALPLVEILAALPAQALWGEWLDRLTDLAHLALRRPEPVLAVQNELEPMRDVGPAGLEEVSSVLSERLRFLRREPPARRYGAVFVGAIDEARGLSFEAVFVPGLAEGLFPQRATEDPLLLDAFRAQLGGMLPTLDDRVARERLLLRRAAAAAVGRFIVSYPRMDTVQARPRVPSFYALEIARAAEGRLPDLREFEERARQAASARLGWPAPADPADAVDDAEYDLAWLDRCLELPREQARGRARYLAEVNQYLIRSLRTRWLRWDHAKWCPADGLVDPGPAAREALAGYRLGARAWSPTSLQHYAACPYRFVLHAMHRLRPREESVPLEELDPLTRGLVFHAVQFALFRELESAGIEACGAAELPRVLDLADRVLDRIAARFEEQLAPAIPRVWQSEIEDLRTDLRGWLIDSARQQGGWQPWRFEFSFGLGEEGGGRDPRSSAEAVIVDGVRLCGSIDLVERRGGELRATDHKTGKAPEKPVVATAGGTVIQPMLYALAAEQLFGMPVVSGRLFFCTQRGGYVSSEVPLTEQNRERVRRLLGVIDGAIECGFLPAAPQEGACEMCDYRIVCGPYEETRVRRKRRDRLAPLDEVRSLP